MTPELQHSLQVEVLEGILLVRQIEDLYSTVTAETSGTIFRRSTYFCIHATKFKNVSRLEFGSMMRRREQAGWRFCVPAGLMTNLAELGIPTLIKNTEFTANPLITGRE
jgi:hypothetical protein